MGVVIKVFVYVLMSLKKKKNADALFWLFSAICRSFFTHPRLPRVNLTWCERNDVGISGLTPRTSGWWCTLCYCFVIVLFCSLLCSVLQLRSFWESMGGTCSSWRFVSSCWSNTWVRREPARSTRAPLMKGHRVSLYLKCPVNQL